MSDIAWAWLAGFIDGEGAIGLHRERDKRKGPNYRNYRPSLQVTNSVRKSLERTKDIIGHGNIVKAAKRPNQKQQYHYQIRDRKTLIKTLTRLTPFLVIKDAQAKKLLEFLLRRDKVVGRGRYAPYTEDDMVTYKELKMINKLGDAPTPAEEMTGV